MMGMGDYWKAVDGERLHRFKLYNNRQVIVSFYFVG